MRFEPPRCPHTDCPRFRDPGERFFIRHGYYTARVHTDPVPRFKCRECRRTFSRQTFRLSYRDRKPHLNRLVLRLTMTGKWLNATARTVSLTRMNLRAKVRKMCRHARHFNRNMLARGPLPGRAPNGANGPTRIQFDEFETYEFCRNTMPLTVATAIEPVSRYIIATVVAPIRPHGRMTKLRKARIERHEAIHGPRKHLSRLACRLALGRAAVFCPPGRPISFESDEKSSYPGIASQCFEGRKWFHSQTSSRRARGVGTRLYAINQTEGKMRSHSSRLKREEPTASKARKYLSLHLELHTAYRNWVRQRFLTKPDSPAQFAGYAERRMAHAELIGWRQDWNELSPCPFGDGVRTVDTPPRQSPGSPLLSSR